MWKRWGEENSCVWMDGEENSRAWVLGRRQTKTFLVRKLCYNVLQVWHISGWWQFFDGNVSWCLWNWGRIFRRSIHIKVLIKGIWNILFSYNTILDFRGLVVEFFGMWKWVCSQNSVNDKISLQPKYSSALELLFLWAQRKWNPYPKKHFHDKPVIHFHTACPKDILPPPLK